MSTISYKSLGKESEGKTCIKLKNVEIRSNTICVHIHFFVLYGTISVLCITTVLLCLYIKSHQQCIPSTLDEPTRICSLQDPKRLRDDLEFDWPDTICFPCTDLSPDITWTEKDTLFSINASCTPQLCCLKEVGNLRKLIYLVCIVVLYDYVPYSWF